MQVLWSFALTGVVFLAVTFLGTPFPAVNEPHYLCKAKALVQPDWCVRDFFLQSANVHYCFLLLTGWIANFSSLAVAVILGRLVCVLLMTVGWVMLGRALGLTPLRIVLAALLFVAGTLAGSFSGEWLLGGFESKVPAGGLCLISIAVWLEGIRECCPGKMAAAGVCSGLACALHPVVGGWISVCQCATGTVYVGLQASWLWGPARGRAIKFVVGWCCYAIATLTASLPGIVPAVRFLLSSDVPEREKARANFIQVFWRLRHHMDPAELLPEQWAYAAVMLTITVCAYLISRRRYRNCSLGSPMQVVSQRAATGETLLMGIFGFSLLLAACGIGVGWRTVPLEQLTGWQWRAALLKFYPFRTLDALLPICSGLLVASVLPNPVNWSGARGRRWALVACVTAGMCLLIAGTRPSAPPGYTAKQFQDWKDACAWLQKNTPKEALILTPREAFGFKWYAERAEYVCYKDCPQDAAGILEWDRRLWYLHHWTLRSSSDGAYDESDLQQLRRDTGCDYVLTRTLGPFDRAPLWSVGEWQIYQVPEQQRE
ncbi:MAG: hypothetical protein RLZZ232_2345 [Planctomycetota bacterium]|jgi:hypothetical protein